MNTPFSLYSTPELVFPYTGKAADAFPDSAGKGKLSIEGIGCNLAELTALQDNYLIQFDSSGHIYALNIVSNAYSKFTFNPVTLADDDPTLWQWMLFLSLSWKHTIKNSEDELWKLITMSFFQVMLGYTLRNFDSTRGSKWLKLLLEKMNEHPMYKAIKQDAKIKDRAWYLNGIESSWGSMYNFLVNNLP